MSALNAERVRLDVVGQNIANVNTSRGVDGKPYQRQQVVFETVLKQTTNDLGTSAQGVTAAKILKDNKPPRMILAPEHRDANRDGLVAMPDINVAEEMVDMIAASRSFEANLAVVKTARNLAAESLSIGKHS